MLELKIIDFIFFILLLFYFHLVSYIRLRVRVYYNVIYINLNSLLRALLACVIIGLCV